MHFVQVKKLYFSDAAVTTNAAMHGAHIRQRGYLQRCLMELKIGCRRSQQNCVRLTAVQLRLLYVSVGFRTQVLMELDRDRQGFISNSAVHLSFFTLFTLPLLFQCMPLYKLALLFNLTNTPSAQPMALSSIVRLV